MLPTAIIVFREVLEASLVVGIVLAASRGVARRGAWVTGGVGAGIRTSLGTNWLFFNTIEKLGSSASAGGARPRTTNPTNLALRLTMTLSSLRCECELFSSLPEPAPERKHESATGPRACSRSI